MFKKGDLVEVIKHDPSAHKKFKVGSLHYVQCSYRSAITDGYVLYFKGSNKQSENKATNLQHCLLSGFVRKVEKK